MEDCHQKFKNFIKIDLEKNHFPTISEKCFKLLQEKLPNKFNWIHFITISLERVANSSSPFS